ncbi:PadR family transcriptional regulator [Alloactinosynnema sp. L-07]|uniref:PadR family transcriptional regulator n=1 Tax=Alloactinosynnema sp. L-07 TaxID=1653480 RepID=UPI0006B640EC|nr:PadR family transcriptional regulator [Alloactinosynnema sp. L-07]
MPSRSDRPSPLALVLLVLLAEAPMHPYRMRELLLERGKDRVANVAQRNSVYQTIERLDRVGLIRVRETARDEGRPERRVYELTPDGRNTLGEWLTSMLSTPAREFPEFPAALASVLVLGAAEVADALRRRADTLERDLNETSAVLAKLALPRIVTLEEEYAQAVGRAEVTWLRRVVADFDSGELGWTEELLRAMIDGH